MSLQKDGSLTFRQLIERTDRVFNTKTNAEKLAKQVGINLDIPIIRTERFNTQGIKVVK